MKRQLKFTFIAAILLAAVLCLNACSSNWEPPYGSLDDSGYNVSVRFDVGDGVFAGTADVAIIDVFSLENANTAANGKKSFYLLAPNDPMRAEGAFEASRNGYFLAGWYTERNPRVNEQGQPLDDYGVPTSLSGRPQGYTYSGLWNFETDAVEVDPGKAYSSEEPVCTLYAAWIPYFQYEFHSMNTQTGEFTLTDTIQSIDMDLPEWSLKTGKLDMKRFPKRDNMTLDGIYLSQDMSVPMTEKIRGERFVDYTTGTTSTEVIKIYTTWLEGNWFKIYTAEQLYNNSRLDGNYILCADLDFTDVIWSPTLTKGRFTGKIQGNGYKISNIQAAQADNSQMMGGLFGALDQGAVIENVSFENITYTLSAGSRMQGAAFGLLAGSVSEEAVLENCSISGQLVISENIYPSASYSIGLLCGSGNAGGMDISNISCKIAEENATKLSIAIEEDGMVLLTFAQ